MVTTSRKPSLTTHRVGKFLCYLFSNKDALFRAHLAVRHSGMWSWASCLAPPSGLEAHCSPSLYFQCISQGLGKHCKEWLNDWMSEWINKCNSTYTGGWRRHSWGGGFFLSTWLLCRWGLSNYHEVFGQTCGVRWGIAVFLRSIIFQ